MPDVRLPTHLPIKSYNRVPGFIGRGFNVQHSHTSDCMRICNRSCRIGNCASAAACSGRRTNMQYRSESRIGPWLAAGYAMCFPRERNGTTIYLYRYDKAAWSRCRHHKRGNAILGSFCAKQPNRPRYVKRKLRRCERQRCGGPGFRRQGADRRVPSHDHPAAVIGRRPDWN
jgi:hypothetical protein